ncbi:MAG: hypothetical protein KJ548_01450 [Actinobacteria bacterium]|nr:hypothetical protein [Actinomycetota bacterium]MBU4335213.1 hypothetical protein [Actinomycetota bacterium]MCG2800735.1 hypothetical protein [Cellulomonas sp.]
MRLGDEVAGAGAEDDVERRVVGDLDVVGTVGVFDHVDALEEGLVDEAANVVGCAAVGPSEVLGEVEGPGDEPVGLGVVSGQGV